MGVLLSVFLILQNTQVHGQPAGTQLHEVNQIIDGTSSSGDILGMTASFEYVNPPGNQPLFLNIFARIPGTNQVGWVGVNIYLDTFPNPRQLTTHLFLDDLGIPNNQRVPQLEMAADISTAPAIVTPSSPFWVPINIPLDTIFVYDDDNGDPAATGNVNKPNPNNFVGPINPSKTRGCNVPNVDLVSDTNPPTRAYAGDQNACAPAAVANSLNWILSKYPYIGSDGLTERQRLEELSGLMKRKAAGTTPTKDIVQGKISFINKHKLKLKVEYHHASGVFAEDTAWLKKQYDDNQDIEFDFSYVQGGKTKSHAVVLTGLTNTGNVLQLFFKDDDDQKNPGGTAETHITIKPTADGRMSFVRWGTLCVINNMYAESFDPGAGTYIDPNTGTTTANKFCESGIHNTCTGACPALISFFYFGGVPVVTYPVCEPRGCCDIDKVYIKVMNCVKKGKRCRGACPQIYNSKKEATVGSHPIRGKCDPAGGCYCIYDVRGKIKKVRNPEGELQDAPHEGKLSIFPNPATTKININVADYLGIYRLLVINTLGEQVIDKIVELNEEEQYTIDISSLAKGIYMVVMSDEEEVLTGTFVK